MFNTWFQLSILITCLLPGSQCVEHYWLICCLETPEFNGWYELKSKGAVPNKLHKHATKNHQFIVSRQNRHYNWELKSHEISKTYTGTLDSRETPIDNGIILAEKLRLSRPISSDDLNSIQNASGIFYRTRADSKYVMINRSELGNIRQQLTNYHRLIQHYISENQQLSQKLEQEKTLRNVSARNDELLNIISNLEYKCKTYIIAIITLIAAIVIFGISIVVISYRNSEKAIIHHLKPMHNYVNDVSKMRGGMLKNIKSNDAANTNINVKNEGDETIVSIERWKHQKFADMLDNSEMIENVIMDDIVKDMQNEGDNKTDDTVTHLDD